MDEVKELIVKAQNGDRGAFGKMSALLLRGFAVFQYLFILFTVLILRYYV